MPRLVLASAGGRVSGDSLAEALRREGVVAQVFSRDASWELIAAADFALIDGGALYDDGDESGETSAAGLARRLAAPVLLALPVLGTDRAIAALARGFADFDRGVQIVGMWLDADCADENVRAIERLAGFPALGVNSKFELPRIADLARAAPPLSERGEVYLVGAGPGAPDLLTLRAVNLIRRADVALFDRLARSRVLDLIPERAERIYVGKRPGAHALTQVEISALMVRLAREGKRVLRLKGGDPFLFGRGGEEAEALAEAGVRFEVCPGVTAAVGAAASALIPLTHRGHAQACIFVTGQGKDGPVGLDWPSLIQPHQTVAIYMGLSNLEALLAEIALRGADPATPAAIVDNATRASQCVLVATIATLAAQVRAAQLKGPAIVFVGSVVTLRTKLLDAVSSVHKALPPV
jgi:uroporphyrin-III C-methyltransferase